MELKITNTKESNESMNKTKNIARNKQKAKCKIADSNKYESD